jgi:hypothetical protein
MGSADRRAERNVFPTPIERLQYDMRDGGYFQKGVLAGRPAHTNEHIQADCILAVLELHAKLLKIEDVLARLVPDRTKTITQGKEVVAGLDEIEKRLARLEARVKGLVLGESP